MTRVAYVNGRYVRHGDAAVHIEDRGYQFADGVYEVIAVRRGRLVDEGQHFDRLDRSLAAIRIEPPMGRPSLAVVLREVLRRNDINDGVVYLQITRGVAARDHAFAGSMQPAMVVTARRGKRFKADIWDAGVRVITVEDIRWKRCDIKAVALLPNVLAKQMAADAGAYEAWQVGADGFVTEGCASNAWIITEANEIVTRKADSAILAGVTRRAVQDLAARESLRLVERPFTVAEAKAAKEAFLTSTTSRVIPVTRIDDDPVGDGRPGTLTLRLHSLYESHEAGDEPAGGNREALAATGTG